MAEPAETKVENLLKIVQNWSMGSRAMSRAKFTATLDLLLERLEEMRDEAEGWEFDIEDED